MHLIHDALAQYGYLAAFALVFAGAVGLPSPIHLVMVGAGALAARGYFDIPLVFAVMAAANVLGDLAGYGLARRMTSRAAWARHSQRWVSLARLESWLKQWPVGTVAVSRFVPFANGGVNALAGMCRLSPLRFAGADLVGNLAVAATYLFLGVAFVQAWGDAERLALVGGLIALLLGGGAIAGILVLRRDPPAADVAA